MAIGVDLLRRCGKGESEAQMELYSMLFASIYRTSLRIVGNSADAEDVSQESFLKIFERVDRFFEQPEALEYSLRRIAINASIDVLRRQRVQFVELSDVASVQQEDTDCHNVEWKVEAVRAAVDRLCAGYRLVISLRLFEGLDFEEIAEQMDITASTARSQYVRARKRLLEML